MIVYRREAEDELNDVVAYVLERFGVGAADDLVRAIADAERLVTEYPEAHPRAGGDARRMILKQFPYQLVYRVEAGEMVV